METDSPEHGVKHLLAIAMFVIGLLIGWLFAVVNGDIEVHETATISLEGTDA